MKKAFVLVFWVISTSAIGQLTDQQLLDSIFRTMQRFESRYVCRKDSNTSSSDKVRVVSDGGFDSLYHRSASRILTSSQDAVKNGRAALVEFNEALKRVNVNYTLVGKNKDVVTNFGFLGEDASNKTFEIYGKNGWQQGFNFSIGQARNFGTRTILFLPEDCEELKSKRQHLYGEILAKYSAALNRQASDIQTLNAQKRRYDTFKLKTISVIGAFPSNISSSDEGWLKLYPQLDSLKRGLKVRGIDSVFLKDVTQFELQNFKKMGYKMWWWNWNVFGGLKRFSIYDTAVIRLATIDKTDVPRIGGSISINKFKESAYGNITYWSVELNGGNTNFLEEILPSEIKTLKAINQATGDVIEESNSALVLMDYASLKKSYGFVGIGGVYNFFPNLGELGRFLGFEIAASSKFKAFVPNGVEARDVFSIRSGLLFAFEKDKISKTTVGIIAQLRDVPFNDLTSKGRFSVGVRVGIPFNY